ncbi:MAG: EI24 domain-containing protein [Verrucomicrobiota bacterium]
MIHEAKFAYLKAHEILWKHGYWKYLLLPIAISIVLAVLLLLLCLGFSSWLSGWTLDVLAKWIALPGWIQPILTILLFCLSATPCYVAFRSLVLLAYAPFLDQLAVQAETLVNGEVRTTQRSLPQTLRRPLLMASITIPLSLLLLIGGFAIGLIPVVGVFLTGLIILPLQLFLSAVAYIDPYLDRCDHNPLASLRMMRKQFFNVMFFGLVGLLLTFIPIIGWFLAPTYSVAAGIVFGILLQQSKHNH